MLDYTKAFIETQFPVSKVSKESYKERKANLGQTLTGLGKWWGRKPLILVRAALLGLLMPVSDSPVKDKEIFLKILTMDKDGLFARKDKNLSMKDIFSALNKFEREKYFTDISTEDKPKYEKTVTNLDKSYIQKLIFNRLSYDDKLKYCVRPERYILPKNSNVWKEVNKHLETNAYTLNELINQLGVKKFGHNPKVGDCFAGGGSIPFEAARMGADVYASDLNPVAALLTWASLNIDGASDDEVKKFKKFQQKVYIAVDKEITKWEIEHNEEGDRADSYLYCNESVCPECGYKVPLAPSWIIGRGTKTVVILKKNNDKGFDFDVIQGASKSQFDEANKLITIQRGNLVCPNENCRKETPISSIRGDKKVRSRNNNNNLRLWDKNDYIFKSSDVFQERLYAIRYVKTYYDDNGNEITKRYFISPSNNDLNREKKVIDLLSERFADWQEKGYIPSSKITEGYNTNQPIKERGWQYWHQLFNPRQLLLHGLYLKFIFKYSNSKFEYATALLGINKIIDWNSRLSIWDNYKGCEIVKNTFLNQAFNTLFNYGTRAFTQTKTSWFYNINNTKFNVNNKVDLLDARKIISYNDIWVTDPPYADAVNYHELTEFFLAWDSSLITKAFKDWYLDSKRVLAVKGTGQTFNDSMIEIYANLSNHMPNDGYQIVMFTHQDVKVWSELAMILWSSGLSVVSAWNIATETESGGLKAGGNYVKGTVLLTLKKQKSKEIGFPDELYDEIKSEVQNMINSMKDIDDKDDPDFTDADFLLASYASSLKVLTAYKEIDGIDVKYWLAQSRDSKEENPIEALINKAVRIAYDYLIPENFDKSYWKDLKAEERFFIRGLEVEMNGSYKISSYQELARGFGVHDYKDMFADFKANSARLKTPSEFKMTFLGGNGFSSTLLRHLLVAINETSKSKSTVEGRTYLKNAYQADNEYWYKKPLMIEILSFISKIEFVVTMEHWHPHAYSAKILKEALKNEGV